MKSLGKILLKIARFLHEKGETIILWTILSAFIFAMGFLLYKLGQVTGMWYIPVIAFAFVLVALMSSSWGGTLVEFLEEKFGTDEEK